MAAARPSLIAASLAVVADLPQGVSVMRGEDPKRTRHGGAALVHGALHACGQCRDDSDWKS